MHQTILTSSKITEMSRKLRTDYNWKSPTTLKKLILLCQLLSVGYNDETRILLNSVH